MTATVATVAYLGLEARPAEVQVQLSAGLPRFTIVGLPDKAVGYWHEAGPAWPSSQSIGLTAILVSAVLALKRSLRGGSGKARSPDGSTGGIAT